MITLVLGWFDTGLYVCRALARKGIPVYFMDYNPRNPGFYSRYGSKCLCPHPSAEPVQLLSFLTEWVKPLGNVCIIPSNDEYLTFLLHYGDRLPDTCRLNLPDKEVLVRILDKNSQFELVRSMGIALPTTWEYRTGAENDSAQVQLPAFIKPRHIQLWKKIFPNKGFRVDTKEQLNETLEKVRQSGMEIVIQEIVPGPASNNFESSFYYNLSGERIQSFTIQKIRQYPAQFGSATRVRTVSNPVVEELSRRILEALNWKGFANVEFKYDPRDDSYKFIEINARVWQQIGLAEALGINFPMLAYHDGTSKETVADKTYRLSTDWVDFPADVLAAWKAFKSGELKVMEALRFPFRVCSWGLLAWDDLRPFLYSMGWIQKKKP